MKAKLILANFVLSFVALSAGLIALPWFFISCTILIRADKKGTMDKLMKRFKIDEL